MDPLWVAVGVGVGVAGWTAVCAWVGWDVRGRVESGARREAEAKIERHRAEVAHLRDLLDRAHRGGEPLAKHAERVTDAAESVAEGDPAEARRRLLGGGGAGAATPAPGPDVAP